MKHQLVFKETVINTVVLPEGHSYDTHGGLFRVKTPEGRVAMCFPVENLQTIQAIREEPRIVIPGPVEVPKDLVLP